MGLLVKKYASIEYLPKIYIFFYSMHPSCLNAYFSVKVELEMVRVSLNYP